MTTENTAPALAAATLAHTTGRVTIPADMDPISVLGVADQVLRALERGFPHVRFLVTGREISLAGAQADIDVAAGLLEELIGMARRGASQGRREERAVDSIKAHRRRRSAPGATHFAHA